MKKRLILVMTVALMMGTARIAFAAETELEAEAEAELEAEAESESEAELEAELEAETETEAELESETEAKQDIIILGTSDVHCGIDENFGMVGQEQIREVFEKNGYPTILVDSGDAIQGENVGTITKGAAIIDLMNDLEYDVVIPGNHEFDFGMDNFLELTKKADFPYICCNFSNEEGELVFDPYLIKEVQGTKIGFVGVTTPETILESTPAHFQDENGNFIYSFLQEDRTGQKLYDAVQAAVDDVRKEGADYVILLSHLGSNEADEPWTYADVISHTSGIDIVLDGHSHDTDQVVTTDKDGNEVPRMGLGTKLNGIGYVRISAEDGSISHEFFTWSNTPSLPELTGIENDMTGPLNEVQETLGKEMGKVIASSKYDLRINDPKAVDDNGQPIRIIRRAETNLGDLVADAYLTDSGADVAIVNAGSIRDDIPAGEITYGDIMNVHPFGDAVYVVEATGKQILDALEWGAKNVLDEDGGFLQVSGMTYEIHTDIVSSCTSDEDGMFTGVDGEYRVQNVMVGDEALDLEGTYSLVSNSYLLRENGNGFTMLDGCKVLQYGTLADNQTLIEYMTKSLGGVIPDEYEDPYGQRRIVVVEK